MSRSVRELWWEKNPEDGEDLHVVTDDGVETVYEKAVMITRHVDYPDESHVQVSAVAKSDFIRVIPAFEDDEEDIKIGLTD